MMNIPSFNEDLTKKRLLVAPLDWGWGHSLRCVPLILHWLQLGHYVTIACNSIQQKLLAPLCPGANFVTLPGYNIRYGKTGLLTTLRLIAQIPKIVLKIQQEHRWLEQHLQDHPYDAIISDNRYGFYARNVHNIFITHQLAPITGCGSMIDHLVTSMIQRWIHKFQACWIPDLPPPHNFSGMLSKTSASFSIPLHNLGILSRFEKPTTTPIRQNYVLALLSGPEPQRSILEKKILQEALQQKILLKLVRGTHEPIQNKPLPDHIDIIEQPSIEILSTLITEALIVVGRSGYTSILDYAILQPKVVFIPTPGQPEQQYLAEQLQEKGIAPFIDQNNFTLQKALVLSASFPYQWPTLTASNYKRIS